MPIISEKNLDILIWKLRQRSDLEIETWKSSEYRMYLNPPNWMRSPSKCRLAAQRWSLGSLPHLEMGGVRKCPPSTERSSTCTYFILTSLTYHYPRGSTYSTVSLPGTPQFCPCPPPPTSPRHLSWHATDGGSCLSLCHHLSVDSTLPRQVPSPSRISEQHKHVLRGINTAVILSFICGIIWYLSHQEGCL